MNIFLSFYCQHSFSADALVSLGYSLSGHSLMVEGSNELL